MKKLKSIFTDNMELCYFSGSNDTEVHHILEGRQGHKKLSEKYGFCVPLDKRIHPNGAYCTDPNHKDRDHFLKRKCQEWFIDNVGTREEWYALFGMYYDDRFDETFDNEPVYKEI